MRSKPAWPVWTSEPGNSHADPYPTHGKDAFHRVPDFARNDWDAVECVLTRGGAQGTARPTKIFGARNFAGVAGDARRFSK